MGLRLKHIFPTIVNNLMMPDTVCWVFTHKHHTIFVTLRPMSENHDNRRRKRDNTAESSSSRVRIRIAEAVEVKEVVALDPAIEEAMESVPEGNDGIAVPPFVPPAFDVAAIDSEVLSVVPDVEVHDVVVPVAIILPPAEPQVFREIRNCRCGHMNDKVLSGLHIRGFFSSDERFEQFQTSRAVNPCLAQNMLRNRISDEVNELCQREGWRDFQKWFNQGWCEVDPPKGVIHPEIKH
jgi:hypothetical protein